MDYLKLLVPNFLVHLLTIYTPVFEFLLGTLRGVLPSLELTELMFRSPDIFFLPNSVSIVHLGFGSSTHDLSVDAHLGKMIL